MAAEHFFLSLLSQKSDVCDAFITLIKSKYLYSSLMLQDVGMTGAGILQALPMTHLTISSYVFKISTCFVFPSHSQLPGRHILAPSSAHEQHIPAHTPLHPRAPPDRISSASPRSDYNTGNTLTQPCHHTCCSTSTATSRWICFLSAGCCASAQNADGHHKFPFPFPFLQMNIFCQSPPPTHTPSCALPTCRHIFVSPLLHRDMHHPEILAVIALLWFSLISLLIATYQLQQ
jgi:hypothetical protein